MDNQHILTVIVPVYNSSATICRCLDSIINQSLKKIKIIIIDNASTDNSLEIINEYTLHYPQISLYHNEQNMGPGNARNIGLKNADTKYITFLDSDDWVDFEAYYNAINSLEENSDCDIAVFGIKTEYNSISLSTIRYEFKRFNIISNNFALALLCRAYEQSEYISPLLGCKIYRTKFLLQYNICFVNNYFEDNAFAFITFLHSNNILLIPNCYLHYYQNQSSITHTFSKRHIDDFFVSISVIKSYLNKIGKYQEYKQLYFSFLDKCCKFLLNIMFQSEQEIKIQKKYLIYFWKRFQEYIPMDDYLDYYDINIIKKLL